MRRILFAIAWLVLSLPVGTAIATPATASTIGYWRMEVDDDPSAEGLSVANEFVSGSALTSSEATLDGSNLPAGIVPATAATNLFSVSATRQGGANGINATAAWYAALAVTSITVEYWARTVESTATPFRFQSAPGASDGILITNPNSLDLTYWVNDGGPTAVTLNDVTNMDANWHHYAFTYDETTGVGAFWVDSLVVASNTGTPGAPLLIVPGSPIEAGLLMDYAQAGQGTLDELRIDGAALPRMGFLAAEPGLVVLLLGALAVPLARRVLAG